MGYVPDPEDTRDIHFEFFSTQSPGQYADLRDQCPPIYNQGQMSSCTAHAVAGAFEFDILKQDLPPFSPSRLFIWYHARQSLNTPYAVQQNIGTYIRAAIKSLDPRAYGVCSEHDWPYEVDPYDTATLLFAPWAKAARKPPSAVQKHAHHHTASRYFTFAQPDLRHKLIQCLDKGYPFVFGMDTYGLLYKPGISSSGRGLREQRCRFILSGLN